MKIVATSDLHGFLPEIEPCDLLLIAGDICPVWNHNLEFQLTWLLGTFNTWLKEVPAKKKVIIWGNHDWIGEAWVEGQVDLEELDCDILQDSSIEHYGVTIYGSPWTKKFFNWAFNLPTDELNIVHGAIPKCDILMIHGPPYGYGDYTKYNKENIGCFRLLTRIEEIQPKLVVFGHNHSGYGQWMHGNTILANVTHVNDNYKPVYKPVAIEL